MAINPSLLNEDTNDWKQFYIELDLTQFTGAQITNFFNIVVGSPEYWALSDFKSLILLAVIQANPDLQTEGIRMWRSTLNTKKWLVKVYVPKGIGQLYNGIPSNFTDNVRKINTKYSSIVQSLRDEYNINVNVNNNIPRMNVFWGIEA